MVKKWTVNPFTGKIDISMDKAAGDDLWVNVTGDTMTGMLTITPSTSGTALISNQNIILKSGKKLIFDGT